MRKGVPAVRPFREDMLGHRPLERIDKRLSTCLRFIHQHRSEERRVERFPAQRSDREDRTTRVAEPIKASRYRFLHPAGQGPQPDSIDL